MKHTSHEPPACPDQEGRCFCKRTHRELGVQEYSECPYRCGLLSSTGTLTVPHTCEFIPGRDPQHFGFPTDVGRHLHA